MPYEHFLIAGQVNRSEFVVEVTMVLFRAATALPRILNQVQIFSFGVAPALLQCDW